MPKLSQYNGVEWVEIKGAKGDKPVVGVDYFIPANGKDGSDGKNADETKIVQDVLAQIKLPEQKEIILDDPKQIRDKLETLKENERLDKSAIKGLKEELEKLQKMIHDSGKVRGTLGGVLNVGVRVETPTGIVNGINTAFQIGKEPKYIVSDGITYFANNGYTIANKLITMTIPPSQYIRNFY